MSWDDEDADWDAPSAGVAAPGLGDKWDGEDEDEDTLLGDDWDDEPKKEEKKTVVVGEKKLTKRQLVKRKEDQERAAAKARAEAKGKARNPEDAAAEAARIKKAIEASNNQLVGDLFGDEFGVSDDDGEVPHEQLTKDNVDMIADIAELKNLKIKEEEPLDEVKLEKLDDYKKFAVKIAEIAGKKKNTKMVLEFMKALIDETTKTMKLDDCTIIKKHVNVICNKKQKDEAGKKKKGGTKKAQLAIAKHDDFADDYGDYDDGMDDFL